MCCKLCATINLVVLSSHLWCGAKSLSFAYYDTEDENAQNGENFWIGYGPSMDRRGVTRSFEEIGKIIAGAWQSQGPFTGRRSRRGLSPPAAADSAALPNVTPGNSLLAKTVSRPA